jgi:FixJ family two-component response regulator
MISVVDDDVSIRRALSRLIRSAGLEVQAFSSAQEFLEQVEWSDLGCLVLDIRMPGMNGLELQAQVSASGRRVPVVFLTAREDEEAYRRAMRQGAFAYLQKPCDEEILLRTLRNALKVDPSKQ